MAMTDQQLDDRLRGAKPEDLEVEDERLDRLLAEVVRSTGIRHAPRPATVGAIVVVLALGGGALPAAADGIRDFLAQANFFPAAGGEVLPNSEWVDTSARDFPDYVRANLLVDITLPDGVQRQDLVQRVSDQLAGGGLMQEVGIRRSFEVRAHCAWMSEWRESHVSGDEAAKAAATRELQSEDSWEAIAATDGGGIVAVYREVAAAAATDDVDAMAQSPLHRECSALGEESR